MKLYTEEQVRQSFHCGRCHQGREGDISFENFINRLTPIELPSDEEINIASKNNSAWEYNHETNFKLGARYITDKILKK